MEAVRRQNSLSEDKKEIRDQLQKEVLGLQGYKTLKKETIKLGLGPIENAFPNNCFPLAAVHEFIGEGPEDISATTGFIGCVIAQLMRQGGASIWISLSRTLFPPAMKIFGVDPEKIVFIDLQREKDALWVMEEALKCSGIAAVICEMKEISFMASRRLQLAVEQSRVTGFIIRNKPRYNNVNACIASWKITSLPSESADQLPGISFPRWNVAILKLRNGQAGNWDLEWSQGKFHFIAPVLIKTILEPKKKVI